MQKENRPPLAIFDFCETLIGFQTANAFVEFILTQNSHTFRYYLYHIVKLINKCKIISVLFRIFKGRGGTKRIPALFLKGLTENELIDYAELYYTLKLEPSIIRNVLGEIENVPTSHQLIIVSGGYSIYIDIFARHYGFQKVIANKLSFKDGKCTGCFGIDVMGENKVSELEKAYNGCDIDYENSYFYTDSESDMALLSKVGKRVVVSKNHHQSWADKIKIDHEIIWYN